MNEFYDVVDSEGNVIETAEQQKTNAANEILIDGVRKSAVFTPKEKELTPLEARKLRKLYVTVKHPLVAKCGHRLDLEKQPTHRNCESCWFSWFNSHGELVQQLDEMHQAEGDQLIINLQGKKFLHRFKQFMSTLAQWKKVANVSETQS